MLKRLMMLLAGICFNLALCSLAMASNTNLDAQCDVASKYLNGDGVSQNYAEAFRLYLAAANKGSARAQNQLGILYDNGQGVEQSCSESVKWYKKAIQKKNTKAMSNLALMYHEGHCVDKDIAKSLQLYMKCGRAGFVKCMKSAGVVYNKDFQDKQTAFKWFLKAAEANDAEVQEVIGEEYYYGDPVSKNNAEAIYWLKRSASQGNERAQDFLRSIGIRY